MNNLKNIQEFSRTLENIQGRKVYRWTKATSRKPRWLSSGSYSLYVQLKPTIWAQSYPRKYTNCTSPLQELHLSGTIASCRKTAVVLKLRKVIFAKFFTSTAKT